jgi:hypothetical protein
VEQGRHGERGEANIGQSIVGDSNAVRESSVFSEVNFERMTNVTVIGWRAGAGGYLGRVNGFRAINCSQLQFVGEMANACAGLYFRCSYFFYISGQDKADNFEG